MYENTAKMPLFMTALQKNVIMYEAVQKILLCMEALQKCH
jgi:hypothetical protein